MTDAAREGRKRPDTRDPRRSRERALKVLFQADLRREPPLETLQRVVADPRALAMLDDLDLEAPEQDAVDRQRQAELDAEADTTLGPEVGAEPLDRFSRSLVEGVHDHRLEIDDVIGRFARRWTVSRMPVVDRNVLRLATYELLHEDTAPAVVIDEAVELAKALSTDNSGRYVNGVLDSIRRSVEEERGGAA
jgi:N utilization substance protein B